METQNLHTNTRAHTVDHNRRTLRH